MRVFTPGPDPSPEYYVQAICPVWTQQWLDGVVLTPAAGLVIGYKSLGLDLVFPPVMSMVRRKAGFRNRGVDLGLEGGPRTPTIDAGGDWGLVSLPVFKTGAPGDPRWVGSIPIRLR